MGKVQNLFRHGLLEKIRISSYIKQEFLQENVRKNNFSLQIICLIIFVTEFANIARVLFWSRSGLGSRNNQIYFSMYCLLIFLGILWLVLRRVLKNASLRSQRAVQYAVTGLIFLWHIGLNTYDLYRDLSSGTTVLTTALLGLAFLIQAPPLVSTVQFSAYYLLFRMITAPLLDAGDRLNMTITFGVALAVSLANAHHAADALKKQKQVVEINAKLQELLQLDPLTRLLNKTTVECWVEQTLGDPGRANRSGGVVLFLVDLDEFKKINDHYGHPCGDYVLIQTAEAIRRTFSNAAGLGRIGGDEFAVFYDRLLTEAQVLSLQEKLAEQLGAIQWQSQPMMVRSSMGACICTRLQCTYQQLYAETDQMLYRAKELGKGRCCIRRLEAEDTRERKKNRAEV